VKHLPFKNIIACLLLFSGTVFADLPPLTPALEKIFAGRPPKSVGDLKAMENHVRALSQQVIDATVSMRIDTSHGSGVIVGTQGYVLTAAHVIGKPGRNVVFTLSDGRIVRGRTLGVHMQLDAGVAEITDSGTFPGLKIGNSDNVKEGQWVLAAGHPGGHDLSRGVVLRLGRVLELGMLMRTDCPLNAGDSGGPLIDMKGRVIGINSRIGTSLANNLHTPSGSFRERWDDFIAGKLWSGPSYLGVSGSPATHKPLVAKVKPGSPAEKVGIQVGDLVTRFAGHDVHSFRDLVYMVQSRHPGEEVDMEIERDGVKMQIDIVVGSKQ
jgi:serine protease Do